MAGELRATSAAQAAAPRRRGLVLGMLLLVYTFNFIDRQILGVLAVPIRTELRLSDTELGALGGLAFAIFYSTLAVPIAWLADRRSRTWIITVALTLWSGFTALCGFAANFWQLFFCRLGVGVGEAGGVAPSHSLITDYFPPHSRARAIAVYNFGIPIGSALGVFLGGWIASNVDWRTAFIAIGLAGVLIAPLFLFVVREPERGGLDPTPAIKGAPPFSAVVATLARKPSFWLLSFGAACSSIVGYGFAFWLPAFFSRSFGLALFDLSLFYGSILLIGGVIAVWIGGWLADRLGMADRGAYGRIPAIASLLAIPCYVIGVTTQSMPLAFALFLLPNALGLMWTSPIIAAIQHLVPAAMRATASACMLFINNLIGLGFGTLFFGMLSDVLAERHGEESLKYAILCGLVFFLLASALFFAAARFLPRDWHKG